MTRAALFLGCKVSVVAAGAAGAAAGTATSIEEDEAEAEGDAIRRASGEWVLLIASLLFATRGGRIVGSVICAPSSPGANAAEETYPSHEATKSIEPDADHERSVILSRWNPPSVTRGKDCCVSHK